MIAFDKHDKSALQIVDLLENNGWLHPMSCKTQIAIAIGNYLRKQQQPKAEPWTVVIQQGSTYTELRDGKGHYLFSSTNRDGIIAIAAAHNASIGVKK